MLLKKICSPLIGGLPPYFFRGFIYPRWLDPEKLKMKETCSISSCWSPWKFIAWRAWYRKNIQIHDISWAILDYLKSHGNPRFFHFLGVITHIFRAKKHHFSLGFWGPKVVSNHPRNLQQDPLNGPLNLSISLATCLGFRWEGPIQFLMETTFYRRPYLIPKSHHCTKISLEV